MIKVSTTGMAVSLKTDLRFPESGQHGHGSRIIHYSFHLYDNAAKKYVPGTKFEDIIKLYQFDQELSALVFSMISKIEVALRVRLVEALLIHEEPLALQDSSIFKEKKRYWQNAATVASENAYFMDTGCFSIA